MRSSPESLLAVLGRKAEQIPRHRGDGHAQPNMRHHERRVWSYDALIHSSGIMAKGSVSPVMPSQPGESRTTERITAANLRNMVCDFYVGKSSQMSADFKIFHTFV